ncbi:hypothetical protein JL106_05515 [Nakamurella sp. YIM 132084]|uniref:Uncharacterized protein n=1 Tax=Nakamurella leprariae TaxID=2803911 RepID=A0A938Y6L1_9ACTN|nr:hypothetical protein [Nakamurella leprariae]MBM9466740.1 hypothetical protein [Nakamurella leprariae]
MALPTGEQWSFRAPCLTTWEAENLGAWLGAAASATSTDLPAQDFTEPELWLDLVAVAGDLLTIAVRLAHGAAVPLQRERASSAGVTVSLAIHRNELRAAASAWAVEVRRFPVR